MAKQIKAVQRLIRLEADAEGNTVVPDRIHLMSSGHWHTPWHGAFEMTSADLAEMVEHFDAGIGSVEGSKKLPINFGHDISGKAAGWIITLSLDNNGTELWGDIEWTPYGKQMLADAEFRYISPEWNPRDWPYEDPEEEGKFVENVLTGAGLTNIPLFKKLTPIMASVVSGDSDNNQNPKGGDAVNLDEVRSKKLEDLSDEEKAFLEEHKTELTDDERTAFNLTVEDDGGDDDHEDDSENPGGQQGSGAPRGLTAAQQARWDQMEADAKAGREAATELRQTRLTASVDAAVTRGAIKSGEKDAAIKMLMASNAAQEASMLDFITKLPSNQLIASEVGDGGGTALSGDQLFDKAKAIMASAKVNIDEALKRARAENPELASAFDQEQNQLKEDR